MTVAFILLINIILEEMQLLVMRFLLALLVAYVFGKFFTRIKLPAILGWLIAGMLLGPYLFNLVSEGMLNNPYTVFMSAVFETFAGVLIGTELIFEELKKMGKNIVIMTLFQSIFTFIVVSMVFLMPLYFLNLPLYLSVVFGGIALATAPAPSIGIVRQFGARGPVTNTLIPMAVLDDLVAGFIFFTTISIIHSVLQGQGFQILPILLMIFGPVIIGGVSGWLVGLLSRNKTGLVQMILFILSMLVSTVVGYFINHFVVADPVFSYFMIGLVSSGIYMNMIDKEDAAQIINQTTLGVTIALMFVIFNMGSSLNWRSIFSASLTTVLYIVSRTFGKYFGCYLGAKVTNADDNVRKYLGFTMLPHSGVSIFFTGISFGIIAPLNPEAGAVIQGTIAAAAIINEVIAVYLAKQGFKKAGEIAPDA